MKQKILYSLSIGTVLGLATVFATLMSAPDDACAAGGCGPVEQTPSQTVSAGSSCAQAESILLGQLQTYAGCDGGFCSSQLVITQQCQMNDPKWYPVTGHLVFECQVPSRPPWL